MAAAAATCITVALISTSTHASGPTSPKSSKPHIVMHLADDFGWANAGWHRTPDFKEVQTPIMNSLLNILLQASIADHSIYLIAENLGTNAWNPKDPVSGFSAIPRNMTGLAHVMKAGGYATHQVGKWDAGMATPDHTPQGRGYDSSLGYFCHCNDYWNEGCGGGLVDLWDTSGPAFGKNGSCKLPNGSSLCTPPGTNRAYTIGPEPLYEEYRFVQRVLNIIENHPATTPLFLNYDSHIVHSPLQVPTKYFEKFAFIQNSDVPDWDYHRHLYAAMVNYLDTAVGTIVDALQRKEMWENTLWVFQSDNGGPSFTGDNHTANNFPLRGAKYSNWQGGIRVNAFVSGPFLAKTAPHRVGSKLEGMVSIADWYATFAALAQIEDTTDHRAAAAGLPPLDSLNMWPYLSGQVDESPRTDLFADHNVLIKGRFKLMVGRGVGDTSNDQDPCPEYPGYGACIPSACWAGPQYPNASVPSPNCSHVELCEGKGCLYNIIDDPEERVNLGTDPGHSKILEDLYDTLTTFRKKQFLPKRTGGDQNLAQKIGMTKYKGFWGPFLN
eukprot:UC4_evm2s153